MTEAITEIGRLNRRIAELEGRVRVLGERIAELEAAAIPQADYTAAVDAALSLTADVQRLEAEIASRDKRIPTAKRTHRVSVNFGSKRAQMIEE
jgi:hypothetical protein